MRLSRFIAVSRDRSWLCGITLVMLLMTSVAAADPVSGRVVIRTRGQGPAATAIVYAEPLQGSAPSRPGKFVMTQNKKAFVPRAVAVPVGSTIVFPNDDAIFHNVFSLSSPQPFDLGLYRAGASKSLTFTQPGSYLVFCNIHPQMSAFLVVAPSPWTTTAAPDGRWTLDLQPGRYRVTALSERASPVSTEIQVGGSSAAAVELALDESVFVQHTNKFGKPYPKEAYKRP
jgi:plastocyanin